MYLSIELFLFMYLLFCSCPPQVLVQSGHHAPGEEGLQPLQDAKGLRPTLQRVCLKM